RLRTRQRFEYYLIFIIIIPRLRYHSLYIRDIPMARSKTAQPKHSLRKIAVVVATAVSGMSVYAQAAVEPKE
ncbi:Ferrichrome-iron receptor, partial [human gut metagenome]